MTREQVQALILEATGTHMADDDAEALAALAERSADPTAVVDAVARLINRQIAARLAVVLGTA